MSIIENVKKAYNENDIKKAVSLIDCLTCEDEVNSEIKDFNLCNICFKVWKLRFPNGVFNLTK